MGLEALAAFGRKKATRDQLLRALCEHDKWFVPANVAHEFMSASTFECLTVWGAQSKVPADQLYLFTDVESGARAAQRLSLGPYASPVPGPGLFAQLPKTLREVHVNFGSDDAWFMGGDWLELARRWGASVAFERMLSGRVKGELTAAIIEFPAFTTLKTPEGLAKSGSSGMIFTAPDCVDAAIAHGGAAAKKWQRVTASGAQVFSAFSKLGVDGFVFNPHGPGPTKTIDEALCWGIVTAIAAREKA